MQELPIQPAGEGFKLSKLDPDGTGGLKKAKTLERLDIKFPILKNHAVTLEKLAQA